MCTAYCVLVPLEGGDLSAALELAYIFSPHVYTDRQCINNAFFLYLRYIILSVCNSMIVYLTICIYVSISISFSICNTHAQFLRIITAVHTSRLISDTYTYTDTRTWRHTLIHPGLSPPTTHTQPATDGPTTTGFTTSTPSSFKRTRRSRIRDRHQPCRAHRRRLRMSGRMRAHLDVRTQPPATNAFAAICFSSLTTVFACRAGLLRRNRRSSHGRTVTRSPKAPTGSKPSP